MGKINFTKQDIRKEGDKVLIEIQQQQEYSLENIKNVIEDLDKAIEENEKMISGFEELEEKSLEQVKKTHESQMNDVVLSLAMTEEKWKETAWNKFNSNREKIVKFVNDRDKILQDAINREKDRLNKLKLQILDGIEKSKNDKDIFTNAINGK